MKNRSIFSSGVLEEARFFGIESLVPQLLELIVSRSRSRDMVPLSRRDVINALILTPIKDELRFQGVNLAGSDLSRLDLRNINFKVCGRVNEGPNRYVPYLFGYFFVIYFIFIIFKI